MPLIKSKSKKALGKNIAIEVDAGKPQKQAIAIAYDVQRRAKKSNGGKVEKGVHEDKINSGMSDAGMKTRLAHHEGQGGPRSQENKKDSKKFQREMHSDAKEMHKGVLNEIRSMPKPNLMASGGEVESEQEMNARHSKEREQMYARGGHVKSPEVNHLDDAFSGDSVAQAIRRKRMAKGGMISSDSDDEGPGSRRDFNIESKDENYTDSGENFSYSNDGEIGDDREDNAENMDDSDDIARIMRKLKSKRGD